MLSAIANKRKIDDATSKKDDVAPVYLLEEIWQLVHTSNQEVVAGLIDYVIRRLGQSSPIVKQKTLRLIKFLCGKGASDFKRGIAKNAGAVRDLVHYKGSPDPFKGDLPNQKVRDTAKEAVEAIFAPTEAPTYTQPSSSIQSRIQGFGSSQEDSHPTSSSSSGARGGAGGSGMLGFGNPNYDSRPPSSSNMARSSSSRGFGRRGGYEAPGEAPPKASAGPGLMERMGSGALSPRAIMSSISAKGSELMQGRRGPGILSVDDNTGYSSDEADRGYDRPGGGDSQAAPAPSSKRAENGAAGRSHGGGGGEARLVDQICTPGGLRAQPTREDLRVFVESAGSLNGDTLAQLLEAKMTDPSWQAVLRALTALEAVIQHGSTAACGQIAVYFQTDPTALEAAKDFPQASVRQRATRVLQLLGVSATSGRSSATAAPGGASTSAPDLLGGLMDEPEAPQATQPAGGASDLLGDLMSGRPSPSAPASTAPNGMFSGLDLPASDPPPPQAAEADFFGAMTAPGPASQPQKPAPQQALAAPEDPFGSFAGASTQDAGAGGDLFGGLSVGPAATSSGPADLMGGGDFGTSNPTSNPPAGSSGQGELADIFSGLSTGPSGLGGGSPSAPQLAAHRSASAEKQADPLAGVGLPQTQHAPMGQGLSAQRGSSPTAQTAFSGGQQAGFPGMGMQQLTPQQIQYMRQVQYMQYMQAQQMQAMQAAGRGMPQGQAPQMGFGAFGQPQMGAGFAPSQGGGLPHFQQPSLAKAHPGVGSGNGLDFLGRTSSPTQASSTTLGISQQSDFDFVNDHVKGLRSKK